MLATGALRLRTGFAPNVKSRHALNTPIWWLYSMWQQGKVVGLNTGATEARRLRTGLQLFEIVINY